MKIYAANKPLPVTPFDEYIGKDLWVKCMLFHDDNVFLYVRFLNKFWFELPSGKELPALHITYIPERDINLLRRIYPMGFADTCAVFENNIQVVEPLEIYNTSDLYEYEEKRDLLHSLVGSDVWVEAFDGYEDGYVRIHDITDDIITYNRIEQGDVVNIEHGVTLTKSWYKEIAEQLDQNTIHKKYIDGISVYEPLHAITTEELQELLEQCPVEPEDDDE